MDINLIILAELNLVLMFALFIMVLSNSNWSRDYRICKNEICDCKIIIAELKAELKFMNGGNNG